jgi:uncharacterized protein YutE (UPF0331/DUF86 family)
MTDLELLTKRLAFIESCVAEIRDLADPERIGSDVREEQFVEHTLQIAIQAALDVGSHIVSDQRFGEPGTYREIFELLIRRGWLPDSLSEPLRNMVGLRNILVHGYETVSPAIVRQIVDEHLDDLLAFVSEIRSRLGGE